MLGIYVARDVHLAAKLVFALALLMGLSVTRLLPKMKPSKLLGSNIYFLCYRAAKCIDPQFSVFALMPSSMCNKFYLRLRHLRVFALPFLSYSFLWVTTLSMHRDIFLRVNFFAE